MRNQLSSGIAVRALLLSLAVFAVAPQPAAAEGFFESIFGFLGSKPNPNPPARAVRPMSQSPSRTNPFSVEDAQPRGFSRSPSGRYKTVCVRLCDGFYFPINNTSRRRQFYEDAEQCQARCNRSEARLFYMAPSASINQARDQRGLAYGKLKNAFLYRKELKKNCTCRAEPWSVSERMRHKSYAIAEAGRSLPADVEVSVAGVDPNLIQPAQPHMISEGAMSVTAEDIAAAAPVPMAIVPQPRAVRRTQYYAPEPAQGPLRRTKTRPAKKKWGLGASGENTGGNSFFPKVKYKHKWPGDTN